MSKFLHLTEEQFRKSLAFVAQYDGPHDVVEGEVEEAQRLSASNPDPVEEQYAKSAYSLRKAAQAVVIGVDTGLVPNPNHDEWLACVDRLREALKQSDWISVEDERKPHIPDGEECVEILVAFMEGGSQQCDVALYWRDGSFSPFEMPLPNPNHDEWLACVDRPRVTHWMPLPELPEVKK